MFILFLLGLLLLLGFISFATYRTAELLRDAAIEENVLLLPAENVARLFMIGLSIGLGVLSGVGAETLGWLPPEPLADIGIGIVAGAAISLVLLLPTRWVQQHRPEWYSDIVLRSIWPRTRSEWPLVILALLPVALLEEMLFRSLLLGAFSPYVNVIFFAVAASVFFGLLHLPQGEWGVVGVTLVGLILSALFLWRGSVLVVISAHWVVNVMQLGLAAWAERRERASG